MTTSTPSGEGPSGEGPSGNNPALPPCTLCAGKGEWSDGKIFCTNAACDLHDFPVPTLKQWEMEPQFKAPDQSNPAQMRSAEDIAKDAAERASKNSGTPAELLYAPILWAIQDALASLSPPAPAMREALEVIATRKPSLSTLRDKDCREWLEQCVDIAAEALSISSPVSEGDHEKSS